MTKPIVGGRPLKFETVDDLVKAVNEYLSETDIEQYTVTGLALAIGTSKQVLNDYEKRDGYKEVVSQAKLYVENSYELSLRANGRSGDIFALKNFGWKDKTETDLNLIGIDLADRTTEELLYYREHGKFPVAS